MIRWNPETIASIDFYRLLFENNPLPIWIFEEASGSCLAANPAALRLLGFKHGELSRIQRYEPECNPQAVSAPPTAALVPFPIRTFQTKNGQRVSLPAITQTIDLPGGRLQVIAAAGLPAETRPPDSSQRRNALIAETAGEGIVQTDRDWRIVFGNQAFGEILGLEIGQLMGRPVRDFLEGESLASFQQHMVQRESGLRETYELQWRHASGTLRWTLVNATPLRDDAGQFEGSLATITDVTERQRAHAALLESENRFRTFAAAADEGMGIVENGVIIDATPRLAELLGLSREALLGRTVLECVAPEHRELVRQKLADKEEAPYEHLLHRADGTKLLVEARARHIVYRGRSVRMTAILDISERKKYEELLRAHITLLTFGNQTLSQQVYADEVVELLRLWVRCPCAGLRLFDEDGRVNCQSGQGFDSEFWNNSESLLGGKKCVCARVASAQPGQCEHLALTPRGSFYASHLTKFLRQMSEADRWECGGSLFEGQYESVAIIPIRADKRTWGLIYLAAPSPQGLEEQQIQFVEVLAPQIGAALCRRRLEENLKDSESNLRRAESMARLGYWKVNRLTGYVKWSEETWRILGLEPGQHAASLELMLDRVHRDDRSRVERTIADCWEKARPYFCEFRIVLPSGEIRHVCDHGELSGIPGEFPSRAFGVILDITEQKLAEEELRRYENIISNTPDGVAFVDADYHYHIINPVYEKYSGLPREKLIGHTVEEYLGVTAFREQVKPRFDRCLAGETVTFQDWFEYPSIGRRFLSITYFPYRDGQQRITGVVASSRDITELKEAEEVYRRLAAIVEYTDDAIIVKNLEGIITNWNAGASRMYGYEEAEMLGQPITRLTPPEYADDMGIILGKIKAGEHVRNFETVRQKMNGAQIHVSLTISPLKDSGGFIVGASVIGRDITQRKLMEAELRTAQALTQRHLRFNETLLAAMPIPVFYKDASGRYLGCNPAFTEITGLSPDMIQGKTVKDLWVCDMSRLFAAKDQALLLNPQETQNYEGWVRDRHGGKRSVLFAKRVFYDEFNELAGIVGAFLDITDRQQAEYNLRLRERAIDASNEGICLIGSVFNDSPLLYVNQGFEQLTGYSRQEVLGRNMRFLQGPKTEAEAVGQLRAAALSGQPISLELINYRKDGTPFWNRISLTPTRDEETNTLLWVAVLTDVSGQRQIERALRRRETELATIQDHAPFLLCLLCKDHKLLQCNKTFTDFVKRPEIQLAGKPICAALGCEVDFKPTAGQRPECVSCSLLKAIQVSLAGPQKNAMLEQVLTLRNGGRTRAYTFLASVAFLKLDNSPRVLLCLEDITLRKEAELQLFESRQMLQALSRRLVEAAEIARRAVARDLHDLVGQNLTLININLGIIRNELLRAPASDALSRLEDSMRLVDETMDHVRNVIADLRPAVLDDYGLAAALRWSCEQLETRTGLHIEMENSSEFPRLEAAVEVAVYRIVQEALTNVVRHARAKTVRIELRRAATGTQIVVRDDGVGFVPAKLFSDSFPNTWGLATMRERAEGIGAQWRLRSAPGQGTEIVIDFSPPASP